MRKSRRLQDLALVSAGFAVAIGLYSALFLTGLEPDEMLVGSGASVLVFWAAIQLRPGSGIRNEAGWVLVVEQFCLGTGINLLLHAIVTYGFGIRRTPFLVVVGGLFASLALAAGRRWIYNDEESRKRVVLLGFDLIAPSLVESFGKSLAGVVGAPASLVPAGIPVLGDIAGLGEVASRLRASRVIVDMPDWETRIPASALLDCRRAGIRLEESPQVYEKLFSRVCCQRLEPADLLISAALRGDARTMAIQAIYTNLIGLIFLLALSPFLILAALAIIFCGGQGPIFESVECAGFQYIPFRLLRFRTTSTLGDERRTLAGRLISRLGFVNLPQLINIVRGDMALVGPRPARRAFAHHLTQVMPFYAHRFSVKPGIIGWAQVHAPQGGSDAVPDECRDIEYDLFYIKEGSLWMDIEILVDAVFGRRSNSRQASR
jgi:lipopolysaccharide/colanic/teichoic acid biosynthesis glycosyltransferase